MRIDWEFVILSALDILFSTAGVLTGVLIGMWLAFKLLGGI